MTDRIASAFSSARQAQRPAFIAYVCAGDPDYDTSLALCRELLRGGTDILELGVPFSDPVADGPVNQHAAQRALEAGMRREDLFRLVRELRAEFDQPIVLYTYYNLIHTMGEEVYCSAVREAGVDGLLVLDCPPEEGDTLVKASRANALKNIFIVAPTTPDARLSTITAQADGFIYYVSRLGVTGARDSLSDGLADSVSRIRAHTDLPIAVGFGISRPEHVREVGGYADGVVVGSALVKVIEENLEDAGSIPAKVRTRLDYLLGNKPE